jgi:ferredoxin-NADP reductase
MARTALPGRLDWLLATVTAKFAETPRATTLRLESPAWPGHLAGQYVDVRLTAEDGYQAQRSYSIGSAPERGRLELTIESLPDGEVSPYLTQELQPGDQFEVRGPIGGYFTWTVADGGPLLLVAGGSGIVPMMSILRYRADVDSSIPARLLYSSRTWDEIIYRDELAELSGDPAIDAIVTLTPSHPPGWTGFTRRIDRAMLAEALACATGFLAFVCGPTPLVEGVAGDLVALGLPPHRVKTERFGPTGGP